MRLFLTIVLTILSFTANAQTVVPIVWPFGVASSQTNYLRVHMKQANEDQKKYQFVFSHKPGAGGSIAVSSMASHNNISLTAHTMAFFAWPFFNPNSYDPKDFTPILVQCTNQSYVITSSNYKSFAELQKQKFLTVGTVYGSLTEVVAKQLQKLLPNTEVTLVGFPGVPEIRTQVLAKNIDIGIDFPLGMSEYMNSNRLYVIGTTGTHIYDKNFPTFQKLGINGFENLFANNMIIANKNVKPEVVTELHSILRYASRIPELGELYEKDFCKKEDLTLTQTNDLYTKWSEQWSAILLNMSKSK